MKQLILISMLCISFSFTFAKTTYHAETKDGKAYQVLKVVLDGNSKTVLAAVDNGSPAKNLKTLMESRGGTFAINGGFFCPDEKAYSRCTRGTTDGLRIAEGKFYSKRGKDIGENKSVFGFDKDGNSLPLVERDQRYRENGGWQNKGFDSMTEGMMMPTLVKDGQNVAILNDEMNKDAKQSKAANKTFICSSEDKKTLYMGYIDNLTFSSLADYIIENFGCYDAVQLDNGGSKAMIVDGKYIAGPGRNIMDAYVIIEKPTTSTTIVPQNTTSTTIEPQNTTGTTIKYAPSQPTPFLKGLMSFIDSKLTKNNADNAGWNARNDLIKAFEIYQNKQITSQQLTTKMIPSLKIIKLRIK